jgi:hypothetical protein
VKDIGRDVEGFMGREVGETETEMEDMSGVRDRDVKKQTRDIVPQKTRRERETERRGLARFCLHGLVRCQYTLVTARLPR